MCIAYSYKPFALAPRLETNRAFGRTRASPKEEDGELNAFQ